MAGIFIPSDLYYADLYDSDGAFDDWDADADGYYGEHGISSNCATNRYLVNIDHVDLHPDIAVGRVPASTLEEIEGYVAKVIKYEYLAASAPFDWFHTVLLIAGKGPDCDPGIHFDDIEQTLGSEPGFNVTTYIDNRYYDTGGSDEPYRPCTCTDSETHEQCLTRTLLLRPSALEVLANAIHWNHESTLDATIVANAGFLGWHDHTMSVVGAPVGDYNTGVDNSYRYTIAFADGCSDGGFAGAPPGGMVRFAPTETEGQSLSYATADGHTLYVYFMAESVGGKKYYRISDCVVDGTTYTRDGDTCPGVYPDMILEDDFASPTDTLPRSKSSDYYIRNAPRPAVLQPAMDFDRAPEDKLFARLASSGEETGWIGMVGATSSSSFPANGELMSLFFRSYGSPHDSVLGRNRLGDMWRSMIEYWLTEDVFDAAGNFDFDAIFAKYSVSEGRYFNDYCSGFGIQHTMMESLFGDPSLRVGGLAAEGDTEPPSTTASGVEDWYPAPHTVVFSATDAGVVPSGVRETLYRLDGGDWISGDRAMIETDGIYTLDYYSVDWVGNREDPWKTATVRIDSAPPDTAASRDGIHGIVFYEPGDTSHHAVCYSVPLTVALSAEDSASEVASTWYDLDGAYPFGQRYSGPFTINAYDYVQQRDLYYWSIDNAGNRETPEGGSICVSSVEGGIVMDEMRFLAALHDVMHMQMPPSLADTLPIAYVAFQYAKDGPGTPQWTMVGTDQKGSDGWGVNWNTRLVTDGSYLMRITALDTPPGQAASSPQAVVYQEVLKVRVSNISAAAYNFKLRASAPVATRSETVLYTLIFAHGQIAQSIANLKLTAVIDPGLFDVIQVLDGGSRDNNGMPTWSRSTLGQGQTWTVRFTAKLRNNLRPGRKIHTQAFLTSNEVPWLVSDDPKTAALSDQTTVRVGLLSGPLHGWVLEEKQGIPVPATVSIRGPVSATLTTNVQGSYASPPLAPGQYIVTVAAPGYTYRAPSGPMALTLDGTADSTALNFLLQRLDLTPPVSYLAATVDDLVAGQATQVTGTAYDPYPGSGVARVEVRITRGSDGKSWGPNGWQNHEMWLLATGTAQWTLSCSGIGWTAGTPYAVASRATDGAGNVQSPNVAGTTPVLQAPALVSPADGATLSIVPTLRWSPVLESVYRVQVDDDPAFGSPEVNDTNVTETTHDLPVTLPVGVYYWRVKADDPIWGQAESPWSQSWRVTLRPALYLPMVVRN